VLTIPQIDSLVEEPEQGNSITDSDLELHLKREPLSTTGRAKIISPEDLKASDYDFLIKRDMPKEPPVRKLPWYIDIFLYPTSMSGLINLGMFSVLLIFIRFLSFFLRSIYFIFIFPVIFALIGYVCYYLMECVRDSAVGEIRAPENISNMPDKSEALSRFWDVLVSIAIFWAPVLVYIGYRNLTNMDHPNIEYNPRIDIVLLLLLGYGIFFFPIGLLAIVMFNSSSAYNPLLWITSIFSTFFQYCGLVIFFVILAFIVAAIAATYQGGILNLLFLNAVFLYLAMVTSHLLGRFYYNNSEKLKWEV